MAGKSTYTPEMGEKIYKLAAGGASLAKIAAQANMPCKQTIETWLRDNDEFQKGYFRAKRAWAIVRAEELEALGQSAIDAAKDENIDPKRLSPLVCAINNQAANLRWLIAKLFPERYGDKVQAEISGKDGGPIEAAIAVTFVRAQSGNAGQG